MFKMASSQNGGEAMKHGEITRMANKVGITPAHMAYIVKRQRKPSARVAEKLEEVTGIPMLVWLCPEKHHNPLIDNQERNEACQIPESATA